MGMEYRSFLRTGGASAALDEDDARHAEPRAAPLPCVHVLLQHQGAQGRQQEDLGRLAPGMFPRPQRRLS